jgi:ubiquinone biosynthesis protein
MGLVRRSIQFSRAMKGAGRLRQIVAVLSKHGFGDVIQRLGLGGMLPSGLAKWVDAEETKGVGERMRLAFQELGPTFVKLGQVLSMRPDLVPEQVVEELVKLQDQVSPLPFTTIQEVLNRELGFKVQARFQEISPVPLGSASIGQVHEAVLATGEKVVIKVLRPDIRKSIETDISLLTLLAEMFEKYFPELSVLNPRVFVEEFFKSLQYELDFKIEANNIEKIAKNSTEFPDLIFPKVYHELSTHEVLVLERFEGIRLNDREAVLGAPIDRNKIATLGARAFLVSVLKYGLFHGDLHGGNLFILPGDRLGVIDFGIVGRLSQKSRDQLVTMVWALIQEDYETLCYTYAELGSADTSIDFDSFQREVRNVLSPYLGLSLNDVNSGRVLIEATKIAAKYNIRVPGDWMLVFRAILTMEGMGRLLDPRFDLIAMGETLIVDLVKIQLAPARLKGEAWKISKELISLLEVLPRNLRWAIRRFAKNDYALEIRSPEVLKLSQQVDRGSRRMARALAGTGLLITGAMLFQSDKAYQWEDYPVMGLAFLGAGIFFIFRSTSGKP